MRGSHSVLAVSAAAVAIALLFAVFVVGRHVAPTPFASPSGPAGATPTPGTSPDGPPPPPAGGNDSTNGTPPSGNVTPPAPEPSGHLTLNLSLSANAFALGQTVSYTITLTNHGNESATVPQGGCNPWLTVMNVSGQVVYNQMGGICPAFVTLITLAPGGSYALPQSWQQRTTLYDTQVPAGTYTVTEFWDVSSNVELSATATIAILSH